MVISLVRKRCCEILHSGSEVAEVIIALSLCSWGAALLAPGADWDVGSFQFYLSFNQNLTLLGSMGMVLGVAKLCFVFIDHIIARRTAALLACGYWIYSFGVALAAHRRLALVALFLLWFGMEAGWAYWRIGRSKKYRQKQVPGGADNAAVDTSIPS